MKRHQFLVTVGVLLARLSGVYGEYLPVDGAEDFTDLYSPRLLAEAGPLTLGAGPQADALNPAISALEQRTTLDASYIGLVGFGDSPDPSGWKGHVVNLGLVSPTRAAVFSGSFHVVSSTLGGMPFGASGWLHGSAAKELYPGWLVGAGLRVGGGFADRFDIGAALDLGLLRLAGNLGPLENVRWAVAVQNIGKWYDPFDERGQLPSAFTPAGGLSFSAYSSDSVTADIAATVTAPGFRNMRAGLTGRLTLFDRIALHLGWKVDLRQLLDADIARRSLIPSIGLSGSFRKGLAEDGFVGDRGWTETEVHVRTGAASLYNGVWAFGSGVNAPLGIIDTEGPVVSISGSTAYLSPNNDGVADSLTVPISIADERFVVEWWFEVLDASGMIVRTFRNKDERPENEGFQSIVDRLVGVRSGIQIPESVRWDGTSDGGVTVPDGIYRYRLSARDDNGNTGTSDVFEVSLDSTPPTVEIIAPADRDRLLSPNGDGNRDSLTLEQSGSIESLWQAEFINGLGVAVRTYEWGDQAPSRVEWDGRSDTDEPVPDGVYRYRIRSVDEAGNSAQAEVANIIVNTEATPVSLEVSSSFFSPNGDGNLDSVTLTPVVTSSTEIVDWTLTVFDESGSVVRSYDDLPSVPGPVVFRGATRDGTIVPEGLYTAKMSIRYRNGNAPEAVSPAFAVDLTHPTVVVRADRTLFSPNGDGNIDTVSLFQETSREVLWRGTVRTLAGEVIRQVLWPDLAAQQVTWNGRQDDGRMAADGTYVYVLESTDEAGNRGVSQPLQFVIDTSGSEIAVRAEFDAFSPNADGVRDRQRLLLRVDRPEDVQSYEVLILDSAGEIVRSFQGRTVVQSSMTWDGTLASGRRVTDGAYSAVLDVRFRNGVEIRANTAEFTVDTAAPSVTVTTPYGLFSPDGDGEREGVRIVQTSSLEENWIATISAADGTVVRDYVWAGRVGSFDWDGRDAAGNLVADGPYFYRIGSIDRAGNSVSAGLAGLVVDTRQPRLFVTTNASGFSPNGDGVRDSLLFDLYANLLDGAAGWRLTIRAVNGIVVREFSGVEMVDSRRIEWDGRDGRGQIAEGEFDAEFAVVYEKGNRPAASTGPLRLDVSAPRVAVEMQPLPFSPDNDGVDDELAISLSVTDASPIQAWRLEILDRNGRFFNEFSGRGAPAPRLLWDGRASDGELVISAEDYPYKLTLRDELGNTAVREGVIPVDILVVRDGDRLKVQISSITFEPSSPELITDPDDERGAKNRAILLRLVQIFDKYSSYSIRVEGHATSVTGSELEEEDELQPLSLARAQAVKDAMVSLGISERRISVAGRGGTEPLVPHDDEENRWKNRRVEFVLIR